MSFFISKKEVISIAEQLTLKFSNGKSELVINKHSAIKLLSISGLEASAYTVLTTENAQSDGGLCEGVRIEPRPINITAEIVDSEHIDIYRQMILRFFNPKITGDLIVNRNSRTRHIHYKVEAFNFNDTYHQEFVVSLYCPAPLFMHMSNFGKNIAAITSQFTFNYLFGKWRGQTGYIMGYKTLKNEVLLNNDGDVETGITAEFVAKRGTVTNPKLLHKNGEFVRVITEMQKGDKLIISTKQRQKSIRLNGQNVMHRIDKLSSFFQLPTGNNYISYNADENYTNLDVYIYYTPVYLGV